MDAPPEPDAGRPPPGPGADAPLPRARCVLVVSASMGMGHHAAADELIRRMRARGHRAPRTDFLELGSPGQGRRLRDLYAFLLRRLPWVYDWAMRAWARWPAPFERLTAWGAGAYEEGLLREVARVRPTVVVSLYNLATQALGRLKAGGRLEVPVASYMTDPGPHPYWVHPAVDLHLAPLAATAHALAELGAPRTGVAPPLVGPEFRRGPADRPMAQREARARLGLPEEARVALVSSGSWAAGSPERVVELLAGGGGVVPLVLCGTNRELRSRLEERGIGVPLGWTEDLAPVMAAADVLVDNAGGMTAWEAMASGLPVVVFRPLPGHGRLNARTLEEEGLAAYARSEEELASLVRSRTRSSSDAPPTSGPSPEPTGGAPTSLFEGDPVSTILALAPSPTGGCVT